MKPDATSVKDFISSLLSIFSKFLKMLTQKVTGQSPLTSWQNGEDKVVGVLWIVFWQNGVFKSEFTRFRRK